LELKVKILDPDPTFGKYISTDPYPPLEQS